jgi:hypothetical protein
MKYGSNMMSVSVVKIVRFDLIDLIKCLSCITVTSDFVPKF